MRDGLLLDNPARTSVPIRKIPKSEIGEILTPLCGFNNVNNNQQNYAYANT
jgi:hypothetical protein